MKLFRLFVALGINIACLAGGNANKPKSYNIEQFLNATDRELRAHKKQLEELQKKGTLNIAPSQAQLFFSGDPAQTRKTMEAQLREDSLAAQRRPTIDPRWYGGNVASTILNPEQRQALNKAMAEDQKIHEKGGAAVYHSTNAKAYGQSYIRTKEQDLIRELQGMPATPSKWLALRQIVGNFGPSTGRKIRQQLLKEGTTMDEDPNVSRHLMSTNIGLPSTGRMESALYFWLQGTSSKRKHFPIDVEFSGDYGPTLNTVANQLRDEVSNLDYETQKKGGTGILLQMAFKNKAKLDKLMYLSRDYGNKQEYKVKGTDDKGPQSILKKPKEFIEALMKRPSSLEEAINEPQTRVILTTDQLLDPTNPKIRENIEFNAYTAHQKALDDFHTRVDTVFAGIKDRAQQEYKARYAAMSLPQKFWHNLRRKFAGPAPYSERKQNKEDLKRNIAGGLYFTGG